MASADILQFHRVRARRGFGVDQGTLLAAALFIAVVLIEVLIIAAAGPVPTEVGFYAIVT
jgi:hypothetical protein